MKNYADLCTALREGFFTTRAGTSGNQACEAADVIEDLLARAEKAERERDRLREALKMCLQNDKTYYNHHEPRRDGTKPDDVGGTIWLTPREIARAALGGEP